MTFCIGPVLFGSGNFSVKHIAESGCHQTKDRRNGFTDGAQEDTDCGGKQADIGQDYGVIIISDHTKSHSGVQIWFFFIILQVAHDCK